MLSGLVVCHDNANGRNEFLALYSSSGIWLFQCHRFVMLVVSENTSKRISTCVLFGAQGCMIAVHGKMIIACLRSMMWCGRWTTGPIMIQRLEGHIELLDARNVAIRIQEAIDAEN